MNSAMKLSAVIFVALCLLSCKAFVPALSRKTCGTVLFGGGWGKSQSRELSEGEYAKGSKRRNFDGYNLQDTGEFMRDVKNHRDSIKKQQLEQALEVARFAGIDVGKNTFGDDLMDDDDLLDVSVRWDDEEGDGPVDMPMTSFDVSGPL